MRLICVTLVAISCTFCGREPAPIETRTSDSPYIIHFKLASNIYETNKVTQIIQTLRSAINEWNMQTGITLFTLDELPFQRSSTYHTVFESLGNSIHEIGFAQAWYDDKKETVLATSIRNATERDIVFNMEHAVWNESNYDMESVMLHELGHSVGLGHIGDKNAVMHATIGRGEQKRTLTNQDLKLFNEIYNK